MSKPGTPSKLQNQVATSASPSHRATAGTGSDTGTAASSARTSLDESRNQQLPKHPTNRKPYPHSPAGYIDTPEGDVIQLTYEHTDVEKAAKEVQSRWAGATVLFLGSTREDWSGGDANGSGGGSAGDGPRLRVTRLEYEGYTPLALKTLRAIVRRARSIPSKEWPPPTLTPHDLQNIDTQIESELTSHALHGEQGGEHSKDQSKAKHKGPNGAALGGSGGSIHKRSSSSTFAFMDPQYHHDSSQRAQLRKRYESQGPPSGPDALLHVHITHRLGPVPVGQPSILIAVSSPHRRHAFEVSEWILEEIKRSVPIWKREVREPVTGAGTEGKGAKGSKRDKSVEGTRASTPATQNREQAGASAVAIDPNSEWIGMHDALPRRGGPSGNTGANTTNGASGHANQADDDAEPAFAPIKRTDTMLTDDGQDNFQDAELAPSTSRPR
ncbi:unnamed protein product [Jaminaea pallidilutea]